MPIDEESFLQHQEEKASGSSDERQRDSEVDAGKRAGRSAAEPRSSAVTIPWKRTREESPTQWDATSASLSARIRLNQYSHVTLF